MGLRTFEASKGLVVDWGGVLTTPVQDSFDTWMLHEGIDPRSFKIAMRRMHNQDDSELKLVERGEVDRSFFETALARDLQRTNGSVVNPEGLLERMFGGISANHAMREVVRDASSGGWRTAILSNAWGIAYDEADLLQVVDVLLLSDVIGLRKPDPAAYFEAAESLGVAPSDCVFVDDLKRNVEGAQSVGMRGVLYLPGGENSLRALLNLT